MSDGGGAVCSAGWLSRCVVPVFWGCYLLVVGVVIVVCCRGTIAWVIFPVGCGDSCSLRGSPDTGHLLMSDSGGRFVWLVVGVVPVVWGCCLLSGLFVVVAPLPGLCYSLCGWRQLLPTACFPGHRISDE
jgi:hypothetical protein